MPVHVTIGPAFVVYAGTEKYYGTTAKEALERAKAHQGQPLLVRPRAYVQAVGWANPIITEQDLLDEVLRITDGMLLP